MILASYARRLLPALLLAALLASVPCSSAEAPLARIGRLAELETFATRAGLLGDDLSTALAGPGATRAPSWIRQRPPEGTAHGLVADDPALRIHIAPELHARLADRDGDALPDRLEVARRLAVRTLRTTRALGLPLPTDDGDGEIDLYLVDHAGIVAGYTVFERKEFTGRGAAGFAVVDASMAHDDAAFAGAVVRGIARLVLGALDAEAPPWWSEASVTWLEARLSGPPTRIARAIEARWNHPELGFDVTDPLLARGNVSLLWSLRDRELETRLLVESWRALSARGDERDALSTIDSHARLTTGLDLAALQQRAAIVQLVEGLEPSRLGERVQNLPVLERELTLPLARHGLALIGVWPDQRDPEGTVLGLDSSDSPLEAHLLAERREGGWDKVPLVKGSTAELEVAVPWRDYLRAYVLVTRAASERAAPASVTLIAESFGPRAPVALSSLAAQRRGDGVVEISWASAWEAGIFGWVVEQAPSPDGPWTIISTLPLPALGFPDSGSGYSMLEERAARAFPSYYRVVALTETGLRVTGPIVAAGGLAGR